MSGNPFRIYICGWIWIDVTGKYMFGSFTKAITSEDLTMRTMYYLCHDWPSSIKEKEDEILRSLNDNR